MIKGEAYELKHPYTYADGTVYKLGWIHQVNDSSITLLLEPKNPDMLVDFAIADIGEKIGNNRLLRATKQPKIPYFAIAWSSRLNAEVRGVVFHEDETNCILITTEGNHRTCNSSPEHIPLSLLRDDELRLANELNVES